jgi:hypothetical protein
MPGCRAWAVRGEHYCRSHRESESDPREVAEEDERLIAFLSRLQAADADADALLDPAMQQMIDRLGSDRTLQTETGMLRLALYRLVATGLPAGEPKDIIPLLTRLADAIGRTMRTQQVIAAGTPSDMHAAIAQVFGELGLDGPA